MEPDAPQKHVVRLVVLGQSYSVTTAENPAALVAAARRVEELLTSLTRGRALDPARAAVYACLHLAGLLQDREQEMERLRIQIDYQAERLASLLDAVVPPPRE